MAFPYTFPITFETGYFVEVDWDNDGVFTEAYDCITYDVKFIGFSRGKDDEQGKAQTGNATITVNNSDKKYSPEYTSSDLYGNLLPKRPIQVYYSASGTDYPLFYGFIEEIIPHPHWEEKDCIITAMDGLDFLARHDLDTALYTDELTGTIHGYILDSAGWSSTMRTLDVGQDTVPFWYSSGVKARFAQNEIDDSELGFSFVDGSGYYNFEDRHHRFTATHQTSQATFDDTMVNLPYNYNPRHIYNEVVVTVTPWDLQSEAELWRLDETPSTPAGETRTWWGDASVSGQSVFVAAWVTPVSTTDYTANSESGGGGDDETGNITITTSKFAKTIKLAITNDASHLVYITLLKARGTYYDSLTKVTRKAEDSTSQTAYQKRTLRVDGKYMTDADLAQDYVDFAIARYKDPQPEVGMEIMNKNSTLLTQLLSREISDRITVTNAELGMSKDFFFDWMGHEISMSGKYHQARYRLADASNEDFWCLGYSALGTGTKLGY